MKRKYEKPNMDLEMFEANEYIAACGCIGGNGQISYKDVNTSASFPMIHNSDNCKEELAPDDKNKKPATLRQNGDTIQGYYWSTGWTAHFTTTNAS